MKNYLNPKSQYNQNLTLIKENFYKREIISLVLLVRLPTKLLPLWTQPVLAKVLLEFILNPLNILKAILCRTLKLLFLVEQGIQNCICLELLFFVGQGILVTYVIRRIFPFTLRLKIGVLFKMEIWGNFQHIVDLSSFNGFLRSKGYSLNKWRFPRRKLWV